MGWLADAGSRGATMCWSAGEVNRAVRWGAGVGRSVLRCSPPAHGASEARLGRLRRSAGGRSGGTGDDECVGLGCRVVRALRASACKISGFGVPFYLGSSLQ
jgi:hypothetical protein